MQNRSPIASAQKKDNPYVWITWLTSLLAGTNHCEWAAWFQANYKFEKNKYDPGDWNVKHNNLLNRRIRQLELEGYKVYIEDENKFTILGTDRLTMVAGKADIVAIRGNEIVVEDCKSGKMKDEHIMQVLCYMLLLPAPGGPDHCRDKKLEGRLIYGDDEVDVPSSTLDRVFKETFRETIRLVSNSDPARKVPSYRECQYCKISSVNCPERVEKQEIDLFQEEHDIF